MDNVLSVIVGASIVVLVVSAVVFLIFRAFWLWYWRVDEQVRLLREIAKNTQLLEERGRPLPPPGGSGWQMPTSPSPHPAAPEREAWWERVAERLT